MIARSVHCLEWNYQRRDISQTRGHLQMLSSSPRFNWNFGTSDIITWQNFVNATEAKLDFINRAKPSVVLRLPCKEQFGEERE